MVEFFLFLDTKWLVEIPKHTRTTSLQTQNVSISVLHFDKPHVSNNFPVKPRDHGDDESDYVE